MDECSAGTIIQEHGKYLLLHYSAGHWDLPKGHLEKDETEEQAALRELKEETNLDGKIIPGFKHRIHYMFRKEGKLVSKVVTFFIAKATGQVILSYEHQGFIWLPYVEAVKKVTFNSAKEVLKKANEWLSKHDEK